MYFLNIKSEATQNLLRNIQDFYGALTVLWEIVENYSSPIICTIKVRLRG